MDAFILLAAFPPEDVCLPSFQGAKPILISLFPLWSKGLDKIRQICQLKQLLCYIFYARNNTKTTRGLKGFADSKSHWDT